MGDHPRGQERREPILGTKYRGPPVIHAAAARAKDAVMPRGVKEPDDEDLILGAILGVVDLVDCVEQKRSKWFGGPFGWILENSRTLDKPIKCKGKLSLWKLTS